MFALRYVALVALVVWVGGSVVLLAAGSEAAALARLVHRIAVVCGSVLLAALFALKFLGPPPPAFPLRAVVAGAMLAVALVLGTTFAGALATPLTAVNAAAGLFLLSFYARE